MLLATLAMAGVLLCALPALTHAASNPPDNPTGSLNLVTSPLPISLIAKPGTTTGADIRIRNAGNAPEQLKTTIMSFGANGEDGTPQLLTPTSSDDFISWAHTTPSTFTAPPGEWVTVHLSITLPKSAAFGYYYAVVFSRANQNTPTNPNQANLSGAIATLVLLDADAPGAKRSVQVTDFSSDHSIYEFLPANFSVRLHNDGNVHVAPHGDIFITQGKKTLATINVNFAHGNILPDTNRLFTASWSDGYPVYQTQTDGTKVLLDSSGHPKTTLNYNGYNLSKLRFGHYTAHLVMAYDNGARDIPIEATLGFWVVPWRLIIAIIAIPTVPAVLVYLIMRRRFRKKLAAAQK